MITEEMLKRAAQVFCDAGFEISLPSDGDLDDVERGRYEALRDALTAALSDQVVVPSVEQFISDMADSADEVQGTERQKEIFKASLRFAISHAKRKAAHRTKDSIHRTPVPASTPVRSS